MGITRNIINRVFTILLTICTVLNAVVVPVIADDNNSIITNTNAAEGVEISSFSAELTYGAEKKSETEYVWDVRGKEASSLQNHTFTYRMSYVLGGTGVAPEKSIEIIVPKSVIVDIHGKDADEIELSVPSEEEASKGVADDVNFCWKELNDNEVAIYNIKPISSGTNGYIEVSYKLTESIYNYLDEISTKPFNAEMKIDASKNNDIKTSNSFVQINSDVKLTSVDIEEPKLYSNWNEEWNAVKPADEGNYEYLLWRTNEYVTATGLYQLLMGNGQNTSVTSIAGDNANNASEVEGISILGYSNGNGWQKDITFSNKAQEGRDSVYVLTAIPESILNSNNYLKVRLDARVRTAQIYSSQSGKQDGLSDVNSSREWVWTKHTFEYPGGVGNGYIRGDGAYRAYKDQIRGALYNSQHYASNMDFNAGEYSKYNLDTLKKGSKLTDFDYAAWTSSDQLGWVVDKSSIDENNQDAALKNSVTTDMTVGNFYLADVSETAFKDNGKREVGTALTSEDYRIRQISLAWYYQNAEYDSTKGEWVYKKTEPDETIDVYGDFGNGEVKLGTIAIKGDTSTCELDSKYVSSYKDNIIKLKDDVNLTDYRLVTTSKHAYAEIYTVPRVELIGSDKVISTIGNKEEIALIGNEKTTWSANNKELWTIETGDADYAIRSVRDSKLEKTVNTVSNDTENRAFNIQWKIEQNETIKTTDNSKEDNVEQSSGIFYDLLPKGTSVDKSSIYVKEDDYDNTPVIDSKYVHIKVFNNYNNTGRPLLRVTIDKSAPKYVLYYNTVYEWDEIADWGHTVHNSVAYETGNDEIYNGNPDNGGKLKDAEVLKDLDSNTDGNKFLYAEQDYDVNAITAAISGLTGKVKASSDSKWGNETTVNTNGEYEYRVRYENDSQTKSENVILYDSIENYYLANTEESNKLGESKWKGTLTGINVDQLRSKGIDPVIYYATDNIDIANHKDLSDKVWHKLGSDTDLSKVRSIAIDCSTTQDAHKFVLRGNESISAYLYLKAPNTSPEASNGLPEAYNNVYASSRQENQDGTLNDAVLIKHDYETVKIYVTGNLEINKVSTESENIKIPDVEFTLTGTSAYGSNVSRTIVTDKNGKAEIEDLPMGNYTLKESKVSDDYILDNKTHTVRVLNDGEVEVDGENTGVLTVSNEPRVHGRVQFRKIEYQDKFDKDSVTAISGVQYQLSGVSDYNRTINDIAVSDERGNVDFGEEDAGTYTLTEVDSGNGVSTNKNYIINEPITVTIDDKGKVEYSKSDMMITDNGNYYIMDYRSNYQIRFRKVDEKGNPIEGVKFTINGKSDYETESTTSQVDNVTLHLSSDKNGYVTGSIDAGTYQLSEDNFDTTSDLYKKYVHDDAKYKVTVTKEGNITIEGLKKDSEGIYYLVNKTRNEDEVVITKTWLDGKTNDERELPTLRLTEKVDNTVTISDSGSDDEAEDIETNSNIVLTEMVAGIKTNLIKIKNNIASSIQARQIIKGNVVHSGTLYGGNWSIDSNGNLILSGDFELPQTSDWAAPNSYPWYEYRDDITSITAEEGTKIAGCGRNMFRDLTHSDVIVDLSNVDVSQLTSAWMMFAAYDCESGITSIDLSGWNTSSLQDVRQMFTNDNKLVTLNIPSNFIQQSCTQANDLFNNCSSLTSIDTNNWNVSNLESTQAMFYNCSSLTSLDVSGWRPSSATSMKDMFYNCSALNTLDTSNWVTSSATAMDAMFYNCQNLTILDVSHFDTSKVTTMWSMFQGDKSLTKIIGIEDFDTDNVTAMQDMFHDCASLTSLNLSNWNVSKVTTMGWMFYVSPDYTSQLKELNISGWHGDSLSNITGMFGHLGNLKSLDLSNFNVAHATDWGEVFAGCSKIKELDLRKFNPTVTSLYITFQGMSALETLKLPENMDVSNVESMYYTFAWNSNLKNLDLSKWKATSVNNMEYMFAGDGSLEQLDLSGFDTSNVANMDHVLVNCNGLKKLILGDKFKLNGNSSDALSGIGSFVKIRNADGSISNDLTEYSASQIAQLEDIGGTWVRKGSEGTIDPDTGGKQYVSTNNVLTDSTTPEEKEAMEIEGGYWQKTGDTWTYTFKVSDKNKEYTLTEDKMDGYVDRGSTTVSNGTGSIENISNEINDNITLSIYKTYSNNRPTDDAIYNVTLQIDKKDVSKFNSINKLIGNGYQADINGNVNIKIMVHDTDIVIHGWKGMHYTVTEQSSDMYTTRYLDDNGNEISNTGTLTESTRLTIENTVKNVDKKLEKIEVAKKVNRYPGKQYPIQVEFKGLRPGGKYTFAGIVKTGGSQNFRADEDGNAVYTDGMLSGDINGNSVMRFDGIPEGAQYRITELAGTDGSTASYNISGTNCKTVRQSNSNTEANKALSTEWETVDKDETARVTFTNTYPEKTDITIEKKVKDEDNNDIKDNTDYKFVLTLSGLTAPIQTSIGVITPDVEGNASKEFTLKAGDSLVLRDVPFDADVKLVEKANLLKGTYKIYAYEMKEHLNYGEVEYNYGGNEDVNKDLSITVTNNNPGATINRIEVDNIATNSPPVVPTGINIKDTIGVVMLLSGLGLLVLMIQLHNRKQKEA